MWGRLGNPSTEPARARSRSSARSSRSAASGVSASPRTSGGAAGGQDLVGQVGDPEPDGDGRRRCDDDAGDVRILVPEPGQEVDPVQPRQLGGNDDVAGHARPQPGQGLVRRRARLEAPVLLGRERPDRAWLAHEQHVATHAPTIGSEAGPGKEDSPTGLGRVTCMIAAYAEKLGLPDFLDGLVVGEYHDPDPPAGWVRGRRQGRLPQPPRHVDPERRRSASPSSRRSSSAATAPASPRTGRRSSSTR